MLRSEKMEEMSEFKYLETVLCKHGGMKGEIREQVMKGRSVVRLLAGGNEREECVYGREAGSEE